MSNREEIIKLRKESPCLTLQRIGDKVGLSQERVRQVLSSESLPTRRIYRMGKCPNCGELFKRYSHHRKDQVKIFCSPECRHSYGIGTFICDTCGKIFTRSIVCVVHNLVNYQTNDHHIFCSKQCQGRHLGKNRWINKDVLRVCRRGLNGQDILY